MTKYLNKGVLSVLLAVVLTAAAITPALLDAGVVCDVEAADTMEAVPTTIGSITAIAGNTKDAVQISASIPIYSIKQTNGWSSNYMKLRDIAYYLDFDVVWNPDESNAMRLYTNRHYLDNWTAPGPATQTKQATLSTMDIYIDDVKVTANVQPVMIDFNNYFKVRDIATIMNFWCEFGFSGNGSNFVNLDANHTYVDEKTTTELQAMDWSDRENIKDTKYKRTVEYEPLTWYSGEIGITSDEPVTYSLRDAWGNYDYTKLYLGYTNEGMNAVAQLMLDRNLINKDSSGVKQFNDGNRLNAYYRYPMIEFDRANNAPSTGVLRYNDVAGDIQKGKRYSDSNFGTSLAIRSIGKTDRISSTEVGVLSVENDPDNEFVKAREVTAKSAAEILEVMNTLSCDAEKVQFLAACVYSKLWYCNGDSRTLDDAKQEMIRNGQWEDGTELAWLPASKTSGESKFIDFQDVGKIWSDNKIYCHVCEGYSFVFENLCNAAGYYYVALETGPAGDTHVTDAVWIPDEGRWTVYDCQDAQPRAMYKIQSGNWGSGGWGYSSGSNIVNPWDLDNIIAYPKAASFPVLDFFYMMEQIKPGGWLSSDVTQNP